MTTTGDELRDRAFQDALQDIAVFAGPGVTTRLLASGRGLYYGNFDYWGQLTTAARFAALATSRDADQDRQEWIRARAVAHAWHPQWEGVQGFSLHGCGVRVLRHLAGDTMVIAPMRHPYRGVGEHGCPQSRPTRDRA